MIVMKEKKRPQCRILERPVCPQHGDSMIAYSTREHLTYYRCTVDECTETAKAVRVNVSNRSQAE